MDKLRIIRFKEKHGVQYFLIPTKEVLEKVAIHVVKQRNAMHYFHRPKEPETVDITEDVLEGLPESLKQDGRRQLGHYNNALRIYKVELEEFGDVEKGLGGDGAAAWRLIQNRQNHEYEGYEIIDVETL